MNRAMEPDFILNHDLIKILQVPVPGGREIRITAGGRFGSMFILDQIIANAKNVSDLFDAVAGVVYFGQIEPYLRNKAKAQIENIQEFRRILATGNRA